MRRIPDGTAERHVAAVAHRADGGQVILPEGTRRYYRRSSTWSQNRVSTSGTLARVADIQKRPSYTPRRVREQRAYRLVVAGSVAGVVGVLGIVLAVAGVIGATLPVVALIVAALCAVGFRRTVSGR